MEDKGTQENNKTEILHSLENGKDETNELKTTSDCSDTDINYMTLEVESGKDKYYFSIPEGTQIGRAYDAAFAVLNKIADLARKAIDDLKFKNEESSKKAAEENNNLSVESKEE